MTQGYVATWNGVASSTISGLYLQRVRRGMYGEVRDVLVEVPGRDGSWLFEERRGNKAISVEATLVASDPSSRHAAVVEVADWLDVVGYKKLFISDQPDRYWMAALRSDPTPDEWRMLGRFSMDWTAQPYAFAVSTTAVCASAANSEARNVNVPDSVDAYPVVEVTARGGDATGLELTVGDATLVYAGTILQNQTITISSLNFTVTAGVNTDLELTGAFTPGTVFPADVSGEFPILVSSDNAWSATWTGTATHLDICFTWRRRYR